MKKDRIKDNFIQILKLCKFETLDGVLSIGWCDERNITLIDNIISCDFNLNDSKETYGILQYNLSLDKFKLTIEHYRCLIVKKLDSDFEKCFDLISKL